MCDGPCALIVGSRYADGIPALDGLEFLDVVECAPPDVRARGEPDLISAGYWRAPEADGDRIAFHPEGDLAGLHDGARVGLAVHTDRCGENFAETEVDDRQVNLTRFPLRFPEKREFFLQGINAYNFSGDGNAFFSRRIGLNDGAVQPVDVGSKLNGQLGAFEVAALHVCTAALDRPVAEDGTGGPLPGEDFIVLRTRRLFFSQSHLGVLYTWRSERGADADPLHMIGVDSPVNWSSCRRIGVKPRT